MEDTVDRMAAEIARVPREILMMKKLAINRSANQMGFREMMEKRDIARSQAVLRETPVQLSDEDMDLLRKLGYATD